MQVLGNHPAVIQLVDMDESIPNTIRLVLELCEGGELYDRIQQKQFYPEQEGRVLIKNLLSALSFIHNKGIMHRDLKPENILLTKKDRHSMHLKIADFGLARKNMQSKDCRTFCGTPHYFAPEVINTFRDRDTPAAGYGKQADMWSLGVILYIMLSGIPPFEEDGLYEQILEGKYEFDVREWTTVSPEAKQLIRSLMTVNPKDRLTIDQACEHRWLQFGMMSSCQSPRPTRPLPPAFTADIQPMQIAEEEPLSKRRRTEDAPMSEVTEHSPLGA